MNNESPARMVFWKEADVKLKFPLQMALVSIASHSLS